MSTPTTEVKASLGPFAAISIIVGIIIGAGIYETPPDVFSKAYEPWMAFALWAVAGLLAFIGALCYAELATTYPRSGGDYVYLTRAYGPLVGYLFGWAQLAVIQTGSIGLMAYIFADYGVRLWKLLLGAVPGPTGQLELPGGAEWPWYLKPLIINAETVGSWVKEVHLEVEPSVLLAVGAVVAITFLNIFGVVLGKLAQILLTLAKVFGLVAIVVAGFFFAAKPAPETVPSVYRGTVVEGKADQISVKAADSDETKTFRTTKETRVTIGDDDTISGAKDKNTAAQLKEGDKVRIYHSQAAPDVATRIWARPGFSVMAMAMVFVFLTYGGWNDAAFVAAEVRNRRRNIPLALLIGTLLVTAIYLVVNAAYLNGLGYERAADARQIAADVLKLLPDTEFFKFGTHGERLMCGLVMVSALGAVNGLIFTSSRIYATLGADYGLFTPLSKYSRLTGSPVWSLLLQMLIAVAMVAVVGTIIVTVKEGDPPVRATALARTMLQLGLADGGSAGRGGFFILLKCTAPVFWIFFLLTGLSMFVLRINDRGIERPFRAPLFPLTPLIFCATCGYMVYSSVLFAGSYGLVGGALVFLGLPFYVFSRRSNMETASPNPPADPVAAAVPPRANDPARPASPSWRGNA